MIIDLTFIMNYMIEIFSLLKYLHSRKAHTNQRGFKDVRYSKAQKMLKFTINALIQQLLLQLLQKSVQSYCVSYSYSEVYKIGSKHTI